MVLGAKYWSDICAYSDRVRHGIAGHGVSDFGLT